MSLTVQQKSKQKTVVNGNVYRQKFEAEVQLVGALQQSYDRLHCPAFQSSLQAITGRPLITSVTQRGQNKSSSVLAQSRLLSGNEYSLCLVKSESQQDGEAVKELPNSLDSGITASGVLERVSKRKEQRHHAVWEDMQQHLGLVANEIEGEIEKASEIVNGQLEDNRSYICRILSPLADMEKLFCMEMKEIREVWSDVCKQSLESQEYIEQFDRNLLKLESYRMEKRIFAFNQQAWPRLLIKCKNSLKLNKYKNLPEELNLKPEYAEFMNINQVRLIFEAVAVELERIGHVVGHDLHRLLDRESQMINQTILSNKKCYTELVSNLLTFDVELERDNYKYWQNSTIPWREYHITNAVNLFIGYMSSDEVKSSVCIELAKEKMTSILNNHRLYQIDLLKEICCMTPPEFCKDLITEKFKFIHELSLKTDLQCQESFHELSLEYEKLCQNCLIKMDCVKVVDTLHVIYKEYLHFLSINLSLTSISLSRDDNDLISREICCERRATQAVTEKCLPLISELQSDIESFLETLDIELQGEHERTLRSLRVLYDHCLEVSGFWNEHRANIVQHQCDFSSKLEQSCTTRDEKTKVIETSLDEILVKLRQGSTTAVLNDQLAKSTATLDTLKTHYEEFTEEQKSILDEYCTIIDTEIMNYDTKLCEFYHVKQKNPPKGPAQVEKKAPTDTKKKEPIMANKSKNNIENVNQNSSNGNNDESFDDDAAEVVLVPNSNDNNNKESSSVSIQQTDEFGLNIGVVDYKGKFIEHTELENDTITTANGAEYIVEHERKLSVSEHSVRPLSRRDNRNKNMNNDDTEELQDDDDESIKEDGDASSVKAESLSGEKSEEKTENVENEIEKKENSSNEIQCEGEALVCEEEKKETCCRTFVTALQEINCTDQDVPVHVAALKFDDRIVVIAKTSIRCNMLNHLEKWKEEAITRTNEMKEAKCEQLTNELNIYLNQLNSRSQCFESEILNVRSAELKYHDDLMKAQATYVDQCVTELTESQTHISQEIENVVKVFNEKMETMECCFIKAQRSNKAAPCLEGMDDDTNMFVQNCLNNTVNAYRDQVNCSVSKLHQSNVCLYKSFILFSDGGCYNPEEVQTYSKQFGVLTLSIEKCKAQIMSFVDPLEQKALEDIMTMHQEFKEKFQGHIADMQFIECINRWFTNTQVKLKSERNSCSIKFADIQNVVKQLELNITLLQNPQPDHRVKPADLTAVLPDLFNKLYEHAVYLHCLRDPPNMTSTPASVKKLDETNQSVHHSKSAAGGEEVTAQISDGSISLSVAGRQAEDASIAIINKILSTQKERIAHLPKVRGRQCEELEMPEEPVEEEKPAKKTGKAERASKKSEKPAKEKPTPKKNKPAKEAKGKPGKPEKVKPFSMKEMKKVNVFADEALGRADEGIHFMGQIRQILKDALDALLNTAELYYRQKMNRAVTRPEQIQETFDECSTVLTDKCLVFFKEYSEFRDKSVVEFRAILLKLEEIIGCIPSYVIKELLQIQMSCTLNHLSQIDCDFRNNENLLTSEKNKNKADLRPQLGHPQHVQTLVELCCKERERSSKFIQQIYCHDDHIQDALTEEGNRFMTSLGCCCESLFQLFDNLLVIDDIALDKEPPAVRLNPQELIRRRRCDLPLYDKIEQPKENRGETTWPGISGEDLVCCHAWIDFNEINRRIADCKNQSLEKPTEAAVEENKTKEGKDLEIKEENLGKDLENGTVELQKSNESKDTNDTAEPNDTGNEEEFDKIKDEDKVEGDAETECTPVQCVAEPQYVIHYYIPEASTYIPRQAIKDSSVPENNENNAGENNAGESHEDKIITNSKATENKAKHKNKSQNNEKRTDRDANKEQEHKEQKQEELTVGDDVNSSHHIKSSSEQKVSEESAEKHEEQETSHLAEGCHGPVDIDPITTARTNQGHKAVYAEREHAYQEYKTLYNAQLRELYSLTELMICAESRWQHYWNESVYQVRQLYKK